MAGPTAAVLAKEFGEEQRVWLTEFLRSVGEHASGNDVWISLLKFEQEASAEGRPFIWNLRPADKVDADRTREAFGFRPAGVVWFAAMCNGQEDHRILAHLCERTARSTGGVIDFNGQLDEPLFVPAVGSIVEIDAGHVGTPDFLVGWLRDPRFHMVK